MDLLLFYGDEHDKLTAGELIEEVKDLAETVNWSGRAKSQMPISLIRGPGLAQSWRYSLELFKADLKNWENMRTSFLRAFQGVKTARPRSDPARGT
jgi:hypothetical protein